MHISFHGILEWFESIMRKQYSHYKEELDVSGSNLLTAEDSLNLLQTTFISSIFLKGFEEFFIPVFGFLSKRCTKDTMFSVFNKIYSSLNN